MSDSSNSDYGDGAEMFDITDDSNNDNDSPSAVNVTVLSIDDRNDDFQPKLTNVENPTSQSIKILKNDYCCYYDSFTTKTTVANNIKDFSKSFNHPSYKLIDQSSLGIPKVLCIDKIHSQHALNTASTINYYQVHSLRVEKNRCQM